MATVNSEDEVAHDPQFRNPVHCADPTNDGLVYACDRPGNRVQVFTTEGEFVEEIYLHDEDAGRRCGLGYRLLDGS